MEGDRMRAVIALIVVIGFFGIVGAWFVLPLKGDPGIFNVLLGMVGGSGFTVVIAYYFGSSARTNGAAPPTPLLPPEHT